MIIGVLSEEQLERTKNKEHFVQKGGIPGVPSCLEHTDLVTQLIREALRRERMDLANSYDSIPHII